jgi:hypothetical protein
VTKTKRNKQTNKHPTLLEVRAFVGAFCRIFYAHCVPTNPANLLQIVDEFYPPVDEKMVLAGYDWAAYTNKRCCMMSITHSTFGGLFYSDIGDMTDFMENCMANDFIL